MPALIPVILTASQLVLAANSVPKFDVEHVSARGHSGCSAGT